MGQAPSIQSQFWNGAQRSVLMPKISVACDTALNSTINCPANLIQLITYSQQMVGWNETGLGLVCSSDCANSIPTLASAIQQNCSSTQDVLNFNSRNMSVSELGSYFQYKHDLLCRRDNSTQNLCMFVEDAWNIANMSAAGAVTWPEHTTKCYSDPTSGSLEYVLNENGTCVDVFEDSSPYTTNIYSSGKPAALAFWSTQFANPKAGPGTNWGWPEELAPDEYPLEIQCSSCFQSRFQLGYQSQYGLSWDDATEQIWSNIQKNCGISTSITPAINITSQANSSMQAYIAASQQPRDLSSCDQVITVSGPANYSCGSLGLAYQISTAALRSLNPGLCSIGKPVANTSVCAPDACQVGVVSHKTNLRGLLTSYTNFTATQFRTWNWWINSEVIWPGDTICVGPVSGVYTPSMAPVASPTSFPTTAVATYPTDPATIPNCGLYYQWQSNDTCSNVCLRFQISFSQLINMNPEIDTTCANVVAGNDYCVAPVDGTSVTPVKTTAIGPTSSSSLSTAPPSSSTAQPITTTSNPFPAPPAPTRSGTTSACTEWYTVASGDSCYNIDQEFSISLSQLQAWNTYIDSACDNLWPNYAICVAGA